jgi:hypothetical protein
MSPGWCPVHGREAKDQMPSNEPGTSAAGREPKGRALPGRQANRPPPTSLRVMTQPAASSGTSATELWRARTWNGGPEPLRTSVDAAGQTGLETARRHVVGSALVTSAFAVARALAALPPPRRWPSTRRGNEVPSGPVCSSPDLHGARQCVHPNVREGVPVIRAIAMPGNRVSIPATPAPTRRPGLSIGDGSRRWT